MLMPFLELDASMHIDSFRSKRWLITSCGWALREPLGVLATLLRLGPEQLLRRTIAADLKHMAPPFVDLVLRDFETRTPHGSRHPL